MLVRKDAKLCGMPLSRMTKDAKVTSQGVYFYRSSPNSRVQNKKLQWEILPVSRQALESGVIDAYVSERPEALTAESANSKSDDPIQKVDLKLKTHHRYWDEEGDAT